MEQNKYTLSFFSLKMKFLSTYFACSLSSWAPAHAISKENVFYKIYLLKRV